MLAEIGIMDVLVNDIALLLISSFVYALGNVPSKAGYPQDRSEEPGTWHGGLYLDRLIL
jgi:hypothetical protein